MKTIEDIRHERLLTILNKHCFGSVSILAKVIGKAYAQVYQWVNRTPSARSGRPRSFSSPMARMIEQKFGKPIGWMDTSK